VIDVVRVASTLTGCFVEVVVFDEDRAMVVGSLNDGLLQPRPLTPAESILADGDQRAVRTNEETSTAIVDGQGLAIGALTVHHGPTLPDVSEALRGLSRIVASLVDVESEIEDLHETLLENLRDAVVVVDADMMISYANRSVGIQIGRSPVEIVGASVIDLLHPDDVANALDSLLRLGNGAEVYRLTVRVLHGTGEYIRLEATGRDLTTNPNVAGILLSLRNGDHDLELESSLERTRRVSNALVEQLHDGIVATDAVGSLLVVNESAREILGLPSGSYAAAMAVDSLEFFDTDVLPVERGRHPIRRALSGEHIVSENMTVVVDDVVRNIVVSGRPVENHGGQRIGAAIGFHDVTEARRHEHELQHIALHDHLTGLPNRRQLKNLVAELPSTAAAGDARPVAETLIDLDNFKVINDTHGHRVGDQLIRIAAHRLSACCSPDDLLVRLGGDEFVVLSRGQSVEEAVASANGLRRQLAEPFDIEGHAFNLTCSIGVAHLEVDNLHEDSLLRFADLALHEAKARGRNQVVVFDHELAEAAHTASSHRDFLRDALDDDRLVMHYQPFVDGASDEIIGFESLARFQTRSGDVVSPGELLDAASGTGLVWELDRRAFELTCDAAASLAQWCGDLTIACNFSPLSIVQPEFVEHVSRTMQHRQIEPSMVCIEITESAAFAGGSIALDALRGIHQLGVGLALDDFGTGYSSLSHLRDLPLSAVKVDRSFVAQAETHPPERAIAEAVVKLGHGLGIDVIAEGVETIGHLDWARSVGFDTIQGLYYSPARSLEEILEALVSGEVGDRRIPPAWGYRAEPSG
jgi:diguanylate cyclase (GGDEF)-like protein/PAS domain S-box-containing protein